MGAPEDAASRRSAPHRDISAPHVGGSRSPGDSGEAGATWALLVAAGAGERLGLDRPKAFAELRGRPLLAESLERLDLCPWVDAIVVAAPPGWEEPVILLSEELAASKVVSCVTGGATRAESVRAALADVDEEAIVVLAHDAARPLLRDDVVERVLGPLAEGYDGVVPALPVPDTLKRVERGVVMETVPRDDLVGAQTPQAFLAPALRRAFAGDVSEATDCASLVERAGGRVAVVDGDPMLFKVTTSADLAVVEALLAPA
jgi:2-C-methyl-D-erythritol 4-phosphate cytidylyltransferase